MKYAVIQRHRQVWPVVPTGNWFFVNAILVANLMRPSGNSAIEPHES